MATMSPAPKTKSEFKLSLKKAVKLATSKLRICLSFSLILNILLTWIIFRITK